MTQSAVLPSCPSCGAIRTPGAPMCLTCWMPFDEPAPSTTPAPSAAAAPAYAPPPPAPSIPTQPYAVGSLPAAPAAPATEVHPPGWRPPADVIVAPPSTRSRRRGRRRIATRSSTIAGRVVAATVTVALLAAGFGGYAWYRHGQTPESQRIADAFHHAGRLRLVPGVSVIPEVDAGPAGTNIAPTAFVSSVAPAINRVDSDITGLQGLLGGWAAGHATDAAVHDALTTFTADLGPLNNMTEQAPEALYSAAKQVQTAATGYTLAASTLNGWIGTGRGSPSRYFMLVGNAAADWQDGVTALYRGAGLAVPALPAFAH